MVVLLLPVSSFAGILTAITSSQNRNTTTVTFDTDEWNAYPKTFWLTSSMLMVLLSDVRPADQVEITEDGSGIRRIFVDSNWHRESTLIYLKLGAPQPPRELTWNTDSSGNPVLSLTWPGHRGDGAVIETLRNDMPATDFPDGSTLEQAIQYVFGGIWEIRWRNRFGENAIMPEIWSQVLERRVNRPDSDIRAAGLVKYMLTRRGLMYRFDAENPNVLEIGLSCQAYYP